MLKNSRNQNFKDMNKQQLIDEIKRTGSFLCVGLDTDIRKIPAHLLQCENPILEFNRQIIDATAPYCVAYKPNTAFYETMGAEGWNNLQKTVDYIREKYPEKLIIADAKRGDIGNTSAMYARTFFESMGVDAVTVAPYMGEDSVKPFLGYDGKWVVLLALTSNKGSHDFQMKTVDNGMKLFQQVLTTSKEWGSDETMMYVVGATQSEMLSEIRRIIPDHFLLVPGVGAQGGSLEEVCRYGMTRDCGLLVNASRSIIYASNGEDFAAAAAAEAKKLAEEMKKHLSQRGE